MENVPLFFEQLQLFIILPGNCIANIRVCYYFFYFTCFTMNRISIEVRTLDLEFQGFYQRYAFFRPSCQLMPKNVAQNKNFISIRNIFVHVIFFLFYSQEASLLVLLYFGLFHFDSSKCSHILFIFLSKFPLIFDFFN